MSAEPVASPKSAAHEARELLRAALCAVSALPHLAMSRAELGEHIIELQEMDARMGAVMAEASAAAHDATVFVDDGLLSLPAYVAANTNAEAKRVAGDRNLGTWLRAFSVFADAFRAGRISRQHVQALRAADNSRTRVRLVEAQEYLVEVAAVASWRDFCEALRAWLLRADPDGKEPAAQQERRMFTASKRPDGSVRGSFELDPVAGDIVLNGVAQEVERQLGNAENDDLRTPAQRRADAFTDLIGRGATRPDGRTAAPLVHITMGEAVATDLLARLAVEDGCDNPLDVRGALLAMGLDPDELPLDPTTPGGRCHLADGTAVHPRLAVAALAVGTLRRLILRADGEVLELGMAVRDFPRHVKDAVIAAHKGRCSHPGCDSPTGWLHADHHIPRARHGPTDIDNCQPLCAPHNLKKRDHMPP